MQRKVDTHADVQGLSDIYTTNTMNKVLKYAAASFGLNVASLLLLFIPALIGLLALGLLAQLVVGIIFCTREPKKQLGQGMLIGLGVFVLVGFSACSIMLMNTSFH